MAIIAYINADFGDTQVEDGITEVAGTLRTRAGIFQRNDRGWVLIAQTRGGLRVSVSDLHLALSNVSSDDRTAPVDLQPCGEGVWTALSLKDPDGPSMAMLLAVNWTILDDMLTPFAMLLSFALRRVRERDVRRSAEVLSSRRVADPLLLVSGGGAIVPPGCGVRPQHGDGVLVHRAQRRRRLPPRLSTAARSWRRQFSIRRHPA